MQAEPYGSTLPPDERHPLSGMDDYRKVLRDNLGAQMKAQGYTIKKPPTAYYTEGTKKGKKVSQRTIQYMLAPESPYSPRLDAIAAVSLALGLQPADLLDPDFSRRAKLAADFEATVEAEVAKRMTARLQELQSGLEGLLRAQHATGVSGVSPDEGSDPEAPGGSQGNRTKRSGD
jgi:hypothetical protein